MGKRRIIVAALVTLAAAAYWWLIARNIAFAVGGSDSSGYMSEARMFASGRLSIPVEPVRALKISPDYTPLFVPIGFRPASGARMVPSYPPGLPIHFAVAAMIGGWERAPFYVSPIFAMWWRHSGPCWRCGLQCAQRPARRRHYTCSPGSPSRLACGFALQTY